MIGVREEGSVRPCSALIASGVHENEKGLRQVLGLQVGESESQASWSALFVGAQGAGALPAWTW